MGARRDGTSAALSPGAGASGGERRHRPQETRERILAAATALFRRKGYAQTSTQEIAAEAGVAEGSIFYHFGSKKNLLAALGTVYALEKIRAMRGGTEDLADLEPGLMIARAFDYVEQHGFLDDNIGLPIDSPELQPFMTSSREVVVEFIEQCMRASLAGRARKDIDIELAASLSYAAVCDALCRVFAGPDRDRKDRVIAETVRFVRAAVGYQAENEHD